MSATGDGLGRVFNVIAAASGLQIPVSHVQAVTFVSFLDAGSQTMTFTQHKQTGAGVPTAEANLTFASKTYHRGPGVGGLWTAVTATATNVLNPGTDATNDTLVATVRARELTVDYPFVECTASSGILIAILHDLNYPSDPTTLFSSIALP